MSRVATLRCSPRARRAAIPDAHACAPLTVHSRDAHGPMPATLHHARARPTARIRSARPFHDATTAHNVHAAPARSLHHAHAKAQSRHGESEATTTSSKSGAARARAFECHAATLIRSVRGWQNPLTPRLTCTSPFLASHAAHHTSRAHSAARQPRCMLQARCDKYRVVRGAKSETDGLGCVTRLSELYLAKSARGLCYISRHFTGLARRLTITGRLPYARRPPYTPRLWSSAGLWPWRSWDLHHGSRSLECTPRYALCGRGKLHATFTLPPTPPTTADALLEMWQGTNPSRPFIDASTLPVGRVGASAAQKLGPVVFFGLQHLYCNGQSMSGFDSRRAHGCGARRFTKKDLVLHLVTRHCLPIFGTLQAPAHLVRLRLQPAEQKRAVSRAVLKKKRMAPKLENDSDKSFKKPRLQEDSNTSVSSKRVMEVGTALVSGQRKRPRSAFASQPQADNLALFQDDANKRTAHLFTFSSTIPLLSASPVLPALSLASLEDPSPEPMLPSVSLPAPEPTLPPVSLPSPEPMLLSVPLPVLCLDPYPSPAPSPMLPSLTLPSLEGPSPAPTPITLPTLPLAPLPTLEEYCRLRRIDERTQNRLVKLEYEPGQPLEDLRALPEEDWKGAGFTALSWPALLRKLA
ncbi:hypothetical protein GGX14DRAFT_602543 [Mycena pura]|uniref:Uncharacterized protein n=1 Tax=Mycena pura TaxID=153505 RepID=A0AAD6YFL2_9AGAR|nr:hypothetical protein GGX14DRAFT_602543 [Mycena pura]